ncbi:sporulation transcriptional regulator SpoIIID [Methanoregula sp.]|uniref:sporulation transcriptional regulator SpoIIID n=1 Tax=Methanoregula sp. TaxID=2052170 RepID=UPI0025DF8891|nr:sporulation transcriptional regulator SpoIIID [Methanoregula sp.]
MTSVDWQCTICSSPRRTDIEAAIVNGRTVRSIAEEFGVSKSTVHRHKNEGHICRTMQKAAGSPLCPDDKRGDIVAITQAEDMVKWTKGLLGKAVRILDAAEAEGDKRTALAGIREARASIETLYNLTNSVAGMNVRDLTVNQGVSPKEYSETISRVIRALEPYPDARIAVLAALEGMKVIECPTE